MTALDRGPDVSIRAPHGPEEHPLLVDIWRSAVDATHEFLTDEHRDEIESRLATEFLPQVDLHIAVSGGVPVGFAGVSTGKLEMLFVDASARGRGVGSALLSFVVANCGVGQVDVNEQNAEAVEFYRRRGFAIVDRSALDDEGRPYPVVHMRL